MKRILLIVAAVVGVVVLAGAVILYANKDRIAGYAIDRTLAAVETQITRHVPDAAERDSVKAEFSLLHKRLQEGKVSVSEVRDFAALFYMSTKDETLDSAEVGKLMERLHRLAGTPPQLDH
ncbi:MAG: hypothetical protein AB1428_13555 [Bacteroidota bacterium]